jgi:glycosyltransferase involved in cell wall biosynthesis
VLKDRDWAWDIIGDGPQRAELEQRVARSPFAARIVFRGWLQPDEIQQVLKSTHVFLHPARWDPFPVAVLEAMAAGLAVLGSDRSGSVVDRVRDRINGFIHRSGDVAALASHIGAVTESPARAREMCEEARRSAEAWPVQRGVDILAAHVG